MSHLEHYLDIHRLLAQLPSWQAGHVPRPPLRKSRPRPKRNGIYFMYEKGEDFWHGGTNFERIVSVGVNEAEGRFDGRLKDYGRDWGTPLHKYIVNALARKDDVPQDQISDWIVTNHVIENFRYRKIYLESADSARSWERKVIPTIALSSPQFASEHWLGRFVDLPFQTWNKEYTSGRGFSAEDMRNFAELVKAEIER